MTHISRSTHKIMQIVALAVLFSHTTHTVFAGDLTLTNPLGSTETIPQFLLKVIDILLVFATPLIVLYIMYAGYLFVTAQGNPAKVTEARTALLWAVVGGVIVLGARIIVTVVQGTADGFK